MVASAVLFAGLWMPSASLAAVGPIVTMTCKQRNVGDDGRWIETSATRRVSLEPDSVRIDDDRHPKSGLSVSVQSEPGGSMLHEYVLPSGQQVRYRVSADDAVMMFGIYGPRARFECLP